MEDIGRKEEEREEKEERRKEEEEEREEERGGSRKLKRRTGHRRKRRRKWKWEESGEEGREGGHPLMTSTINQGFDPLSCLGSSIQPNASDAFPLFQISPSFQMEEEDYTEE